MDLVFLVWELGKRGCFETTIHSSRLHCSDVEWGALPTTVLRKWSNDGGTYSRPSDGDVKWRSREQDWGQNHTPASLFSEHLSKREGLK